MIEKERIEESLRIKNQLDGVNYFEESEWELINSFLIESTEKMINSFNATIKKLKPYLDSRKKEY